MAKQDLRTNEAIKVREVRLVGSDGQQLGIVPTIEALKMARDQGIDLVEVAPQAKPPVCKILDYGKFKFEQEKNARDSRKKQKLLKLKEVRMQPKIEIHDLEFKTRQIKEFLEHGSKVKVTIRFRGRELAHTDRGKLVLDRILELLDTPHVVDRKPMMEGRFMSMILSPGSRAK
ncbi:translation initiation factor IF-3 [Alkalispirochaeta sphaeroplastigenens]|uniref:Translation initiation factor IF-3 n=1 Tax=Alkalispirochaeta sphaeroplastigenens TaxID=1187066 RepID=A0A2S4JWP6_9SPIO|nr:translation initiation factor IF-3 [Alkalispirochaeta sphaeroplastigenens]POR03959.1 translation initiation factor IF-3 [Alkalispirochaeta sphaeroplastigenens]